MTSRPGLLAVRGPALHDHLSSVGGLPACSARAVLAEVEASGLTGRGGAGFPVSRKWRAVLGGHRSVVVANGAEGEPVSRKDVTLMTRSPHLVLDGLALAARAVGAERSVAYVQAGPALEALRQAVHERRGQDEVDVEVVVAAGGFLAGQESAVARALEGGPARPRTRPPRIAAGGVGGRTTLVQNVETLAHIALITRRGAAWFRSAGTPDEPGTMLCTVGDGPASQVVEVSLGTPLRSVLALAGAAPSPVTATLVGGYHGSWLTPEQVARLRLSAADLSPAGAAPGAGVLLPLEPGQCGLARTAGIVRFLATQSARQCGPCLNGLPALADVLEALAGSRAPSGERARLLWLADLVTGRGACRHPDGTARLARSVVSAFATELDAHATGWCPAVGGPS